MIFMKTACIKFFTSLFLFVTLRLFIFGITALLGMAYLEVSMYVLDTFADFVIIPFLLVLIYGTKPFFGKGFGRYFAAVNFLYYLILGHKSIIDFILTLRPDEEFYPLILKFTVSNLILGLGIITVKAIKFNERGTE